MGPRPEQLLVCRAVLEFRQEEVAGGGGGFSLIHLVLFVHFPGAQKGPN